MIPKDDPTFPEHLWNFQLGSAVQNIFTKSMYLRWRAELEGIGLVFPSSSNFIIKDVQSSEFMAAEAAEASEEDSDGADESGTEYSNDA